MANTPELRAAGFLKIVIYFCGFAYWGRNACGFGYGLCYTDGDVGLCVCGGGGLIWPIRPLTGGHTHRMQFGFYFGTMYANMIKNKKDQQWLSFSPILI